MSDEICPSCEHAIGRHYADPKGVVRCMVIHRGTSTSGILGIPFEYECDCADGASSVERRREEEANRQQELQEQLVSALKLSMQKKRRKKA